MSNRGWTSRRGLLDMVRGFCPLLLDRRGAAVCQGNGRTVKCLCKTHSSPCGGSDKTAKRSNGLNK